MREPTRFNPTPEGVDKLLKENHVTVEWNETFVNGEGEVFRKPELAAWSMIWKHGVMSLDSVPKDDEDQALLAAAAFVHLWNLGVDAGDADKFAQCFAAKYKIRQVGQVKVYELR